MLASFLKICVIIETFNFMLLQKPFVIHIGKATGEPGAPGGKGEPALPCFSKFYFLF